MLSHIKASLGKIIELAGDDRDLRDEIIIECDALLAEVEQRMEDRNAEPLPVAVVPPTPRQGDVLKVIQGWLEDHEYAPSFDEIGAAVGLASRSSVMRLLDGLEDRGHIVRAHGLARSIRLVVPTGPK